MVINSFPNGSYVVHKIPLMKGHGSGWFSQENTLLDAEIVYSDGRVRSVKRHGPIWNRIRAIGQGTNHA